MKLLKVQDFYQIKFEMHAEEYTKLTIDLSDRIVSTDQENCPIVGSYLQGHIGDLPDETKIAYFASVDEKSMLTLKKLDKATRLI